MANSIFAEYSNHDLAIAINSYLECACWDADAVAEWRERYLENGYLPGYGEYNGVSYPTIEGEEHSNLSFVWFLEDSFYGERI